MPDSAKMPDVQGSLAVQKLHLSVSGKRLKSSGVAAPMQSFRKFIKALCGSHPGKINVSML